MTNIKCSNCNKEIHTLENKYCKNCGFSLRDIIKEIKRKEIKYKDKKEIKIKTGKNLILIIIIAVGLIVFAIFFPLILVIIGTNNYELDSNVITLLTVLIPILSVMSILLCFIPKPNRSENYD